MTGVAWFNNYEEDGDGLTRIVKTEVDLRTVALKEWTEDELGFRLAAIYPEVDGHAHVTASQQTVDEVTALMEEIRRRGFDPTSNLRFNERNSGWGWLPGFRRSPS